MPAYQLPKLGGKPTSGRRLAASACAAFALLPGYSEEGGDYTLS